MELPVLFNPFGTFFLQHKVPDFIFTKLCEKSNYLKGIISSNDKSIEINDFSNYLAGENTHQIKIDESFLQEIEAKSYLLSLGEYYVHNQNLKINTISLGSSWFNYAYAGDYNPFHKHDSLLSGVIYIYQSDTINEEIESSESNFRKKTSIPAATHFVYDLNSNQFNYNHHIHKPIIGELLIFPSWLTHYVNPFVSKGERITMAFNILGEVY